MKKQKGFSLIELLIVVAIILIIAAIAIPNLLRARIAANESSAAASIRTIATAATNYQTSYPAVGYPEALAVLGPLDTGCTAGSTVTNACMLDFVLATAAPGTGGKSGYAFTFTASGGTATSTSFAAGTVPNPLFFSDATPITLNATGVKEFCGSDDLVVRFVTPFGVAMADRAACQALMPIGQ